RYNVPYRSSNVCAANALDAQAAYESVFSLWGAIQGGVNVLMHGAGWMEGGLCTGFEKLVMDADRLGSYQKLLGGLEVDDNSLARDAYEEVDPGGHFLGSAHTMRNYKTAFYEPALSDSENVESWEEKGSTDMRTRAYERWTTLLNQYEPPPIDETTDEALNDFVARRKSELPDAWY
ncbi:MAG: trimethylamine methyltransferase, partial [Rhodobacteraceae bacterium]|nr:trimethylamine methyltransferase [Paracoccaceae bacterium]